jgi:hypothetical protein
VRPLSLTSLRRVTGAFLASYAIVVAVEHHGSMGRDAIDRLLAVFGVALMLLAGWFSLR